MFSEGLWGFYNRVEPISQTCVTSLFLIGKIFINVRMFQNPPFVRVLFVVGLYGLGLIVRLKLFPFRIPWRSHNYQLSAMWPFGPSILSLSIMEPYTIGSIVEQSVLLNEFVHLVSLNGLFMFERFCYAVKSIQTNPSPTIFLPLYTRLVRPNNLAQGFLPFFNFVPTYFLILCNVLFVTKQEQVWARKAKVFPLYMRAI